MAQLDLASLLLIAVGLFLGRRVATFRTPQGATELRYDFINVVPPMHESC